MKCWCQWQRLCKCVALTLSELRVYCLYLCSHWKCLIESYRMCCHRCPRNDNNFTLYSILSFQFRHNEVLVSILKSFDMYEYIVSSLSPTSKCAYFSNRHRRVALCSAFILVVIASVPFDSRITFKSRIEKLINVSFGGVFVRSFGRNKIKSEMK